MHGLHGDPPALGRRRDAFVQELYPTCSGSGLPQAGPIQATTTGALKASSLGLDGTSEEPTFVAAATTRYTRFVHPGAPAAHGN
jgi:hypothetical protein